MTRHWWTLLLFPSLAEACRTMALGKRYKQEDDLHLLEQDIWLRLSDDFSSMTRVDLAYRGGDIRGVVGRHEVKVNVTTETVECVRIIFDVDDIDECTTGSPAQHKCHGSSVCVNTMGSYECKCPDGAWAAMGNVCWGHSDTAECCERQCEDECDGECIKKCKGSFRCTDDPCDGAECPANSRCEPSDEPHPAMWGGSRDLLKGGFTCVCDAGFFFKEGRCVDFCEDHGCPCNCRCVPDNEREGYACEPSPGFRKFGDEVTPFLRRLDSGVCVDAAVPRLEIFGPNPVLLTQGDDYVDLGAAIYDANDEFTRERRFSVEMPSNLGSCVSETGEFLVTYTLEWLLDEKVQVTRRVIVTDVDECTYQGGCPEFVHDCTHEATCENLERGYRCQCPEGFVGDGRSCIDTRPPVLKCVGVGCNPKIFRAVDVHGLVSRDYYDVANENDFAFDHLRRISLVDGDPFCEASPCFVAFKDFTEPRVDFTANITLLGVLPRPFTTDDDQHFSAVYSVKDADGNEATASRDLIVEMVSSTMIFDRMQHGVVLVASRTKLLLFLLFVLCFAAGSSLPLVLLYVILPTSWSARLLGRKLYLRAVDKYLVITRFGAMTSHHRLAVAFSEWRDLHEDDYNDEL